MCPSFQATREEMHSTRGRANLLREMVSSPESPQGPHRVSDEANSSSSRRWLPYRMPGNRREEHIPRNDRMESVAQALDLCLACKGCKAECPSGVDMARLKYEFENEYYKTHRRRLRDYLFAYFHATAALASSIAPLSNVLMNTSVIKDVAATFLGITIHRPFPKFSSSRPLLAKPHGHTENKIILLSDPFSHYIEPEVEQSALDVLHKCGYEVHVLPLIGAGASLLAKGFVAAAKRHAKRVLDALKQIDPAHESYIVGLEPPEIYAAKHDYVDLLPEHQDEISQLTARTWLLDEFLLRSEKFDALRVATLERLSNDKTKASPQIYFHPHCHQRAEGPALDAMPSGTNATVALLRSCGYEVELLNTGCCGMAGSFGYDAEHYDLSMKIAELKLFPKLRSIQFVPDENRGGRVKVVSTGAACRIQIQHGTNIQAQHSILFVRAALIS